MENEAAQAIFLKLPVAGNVKTRLGMTIGMKKAAEIYKSLAETTIKACKSDNFDILFCIEPYSELENFKKWLGDGEIYIPQHGNDLGERMFNCFSDAFAMGYDKCAVTGSDIVGLNNEILSQAFAELDKNDCVIGPAVDGGYYMIAFNKGKCEKALFKNMEWSTDKVYNNTISRLTDCGTAYASTMILPDIDTEEDLKKYLG